ncbi:MAG: winged helix-turn-helix domain-containing protein [Victivallaceae bacterium]|nr:winged helix-turn-helix domain-containing protein [Victivallaceae bacterium]
MELLIAPSKTEQVADILRSQIKKGHYRPGSRLAGMRQLAKTFKVSTRVVGCALESLQKERLLRSEHGRGVFVEQWTESDIINVYMLFWGLEEHKNNYFEEFAKIAYPPVMPSGFSFNLRAVMKKSDEFHHLDAELARINNSPDVNCAIFGAAAFNREHIRQFKKLHSPFIMLGDFQSGELGASDYNQIAGDNYKQGQHCLEFMAVRGYKEVSLITRNRQCYFYEQFCRGVEDAALEAGIKINQLELPEDIHHDSKSERDICQDYQQHINAAATDFFTVPVIVNGLKKYILTDALTEQQKYSFTLPIILPTFNANFLSLFYKEIFRMIKKVVKQPQVFQRELIDVPFIINDLVGNKRYLNNQGVVSEIS